MRKTAQKETQMSEAKLVVIYPRPTDIEAFEKIYVEEHVPLAVAKLSGKAQIVATLNAVLCGRSPEAKSVGLVGWRPITGPGVNTERRQALGRD